MKVEDSTSATEMETSMGSAVQAATENGPAIAPATGNGVTDAAEEPSREELLESCGKLADSEDVLSEVAEDAGDAGWAGDARPVQLAVLSVVSRHFERPVSIATRGQSSVGKSYAIKHALRFCPEEAYMELTGMSEKALVYYEGNLSHRMLVMFEGAGIGGNFAAYAIRSLLSEGCLKYRYTEMEAAEKSQLIEIEGPTGLLTSTAGSIDAELQTRLVSINIEDSSELTQAILIAQAREAAGEAVGSVDYARYHALQRLIAKETPQVIVPFAEKLAKAMDPKAVRIRRDFPAVLGFVRAHALLHFLRRDLDPKGRLLATPADYVAVHGLVAQAIAEGAQQTVPVEVREVVEAVEDLQPQLGGQEHRVSIGDLVGELGLHRTSVLRRVSRAIAAGYLADESGGRKGQPKKLLLADAMPKDVGVLPDPGILG